MSKKRSKRNTKEFKTQVRKKRYSEFVQVTSKEEKVYGHDLTTAVQDYSSYQEDIPKETSEEKEG
jgi:hypothetical protein